MKTKTTAKWIVDILMTAALLLLMGYQFWGEAAHEWIGAGMFLLFLAHQILNLNWYKSLFKGKYTSRRLLMLIVDVLTLAAMLSLVYSGIVLSRHVFSFLPIRSGMALARRLHILGSYWGFLLMSLHLGLHWNMVCSMVSMHVFHRKKQEGNRIFFIVSLLIALYGVSVFIRRDFLTYMLMKSEFVFLDYEEPVLLFLCDYLALMGLCIFIAHYGAKLLDKRKSQ